MKVNLNSQEVGYILNCIKEVLGIEPPFKTKNSEEFKAGLRRIYNKLNVNGTERL